jgi:type IV pilus assembly protein PilA
MTRTLTLRSARREQASADEGFTLIELLVVVVIIGVLIAIAVPLYSNYKKGAQNTSASSDVRGGISAVEQFYTANGNQYPDSVAAPSTDGTNLTLTLASGTGVVTGTITVSNGNKLAYTNHTSYYVICGQSTNGQTLYTYNSNTSKSVEKSSAADLAACAV